MAMTVLNESITTKYPSFGYADTSILFAGHLLIVFYCLIFTFGFLGNSAVIFVAIRKKIYRNVTNCYVINLAIADLLFLTLSIPYTTYLGLVNMHPFDDIVCKIYTYLAYVFLLATCNILAGMSIDRYLYIVQPKAKLRWRTSRNAFIICIFIWIGSLALIIPYHIISHLVTHDSKACSVNEHKNFLVCFFVFCSYYAIPLVIIIVCYTKLALYVMQSNRLVTSHMNPKTIPSSLKKRQRRVTRMVIVVTLSFAICWLPIHILELMKCAESPLLYRLIGSYPKVLYTIRAFSHAIAYFNSCLNPYLYALLNRNFCFDLIDIIPSRFTCWTQTQIIVCKSSNMNTTFAPSGSLKTNNLLVKIHQVDGEDDDDDEIYYSEQQKPPSADVSCQVELLGINTT